MCICICQRHAAFGCSSSLIRIGAHKGGYDIYLYIQTLWGFSSVTIFLPRLLYCITKCNNIHKWDLWHFIYSIYGFIIQTFDVSQETMAKNWFKQNLGTYLQIFSNVHVPFSGMQKFEESGRGSQCLRWPILGSDRWPPEKDLKN